MRLLIAQYAGDYLAAHERLQASGSETYYGHAYVLQQLENIQRSRGAAAILCGLSQRAYFTELANGVTVIGANAHPDSNVEIIRRLMERFDPTHLIVLGPMPGIIRWGLSTGRRVACLCADSFNTHAFRRLMRYGRIARLFNDPRVEWVANHGINACLSLDRIGVHREKIIPWDWPHRRQPSSIRSKTGPAAGVIRLFFAGSIDKRKGVGDLIAAASELKRRGRNLEVNIAGAGAVDAFEKRARELGVDDVVHFLGLLANDAVFQHMTAATAVVVPSRHEYPEGLPLTIYEALCSRTPIVASDHPMFAKHLIHRRTAMVYPAGRASALADAVVELADDGALYAELSGSAQRTWERMQIPLKWGDLIDQWVASPAGDSRLVEQNRLDAPQYVGKLEGR